jgi:hypothetical protein
MNLLPILRADAPEEHHITLPGMDVAFNRETKTVFIVDQTGGTDTQALADLENWYRERGWFLHCIVIQAPSSEIKK